MKAMLYVPVIVWAIVYNVVSMLFGLAITKLFKLPDWVTPAIGKAIITVRLSNLHVLIPYA